MSQVDEQMHELRERARREYPHRFAPDGTGLSTYDSTCRHDQLERQRGCGDAWAHRLGAWERLEDLKAAMERDQAGGESDSSESSSAPDCVPARSQSAQDSGRGVA